MKASNLFTVGVLSGLACQALACLAAAQRAPSSALTLAAIERAPAPYRLRPDSAQFVVDLTVPTPIRLRPLEMRDTTVAGLRSPFFGNANTDFLWMGVSRDVSLGLIMTMRHMDSQKVAGTGGKIGFRFAI